MKIALVIPNRNLSRFEQLLKSRNPNLNIQVWPNIVDPELVEFVVAWNPPKASLKPFVNVKAIASFGAGVDSILSYEGLPNVPVTRVIDPLLADDMAHYVVSQILAYQHRSEAFKINQKAVLWQPKRKRAINKVTILGAGQLGGHCAKTLSSLGFEVSCWSQTDKTSPYFTHFTGKAELAAALSNADAVVCLLPLTAQTSGILNYSLFELCERAPLLINVARGAHLHESDLIKALSQGLLSHAVLDVFQQEPLPQAHPFWHHDKVTITPHVSALTSIDTITNQILDNIERLKQGVKLNGVINKAKGY